ncbi:MAG: AraC family transcriptional regulator [Bacteroidota bacterium]
MKRIKSEKKISIEVFRIISFKSNYHFKMHSHKRIELNYILQGSCVMMFDNKLVKLNQNNSILIFPGSKHDFYVDSKTGIKIAQLEFQIEESGLTGYHDLPDTNLYSLFNQSGSNNYIKIPNNPEIGNCMERIIRENKLKRNNYVSLTTLYFSELTILVSRYIHRQHEIIDKQENECLQTAMNRIHSNYSTGVKISDLAKECNISERYLRKLFTTHLESSPQEYCNNVRINKSVELLANRSIPVKEIAYSVGYSTPQYFSRMFKGKYGFSPQTYRKILFESQEI